MNLRYNLNRLVFYKFIFITMIAKPMEFTLRSIDTPLDNHMKRIYLRSTFVFISLKLDIVEGMLQSFIKKRETDDYSIYNKEEIILQILKYQELRISLNDLLNEINRLI